MDQWIEIASKFGIPVGILAGLVYFLARSVWPFIRKQLEDAAAARKAEIEDMRAQRKTDFETFNTTIRARDILMAESQRETIRALQEMTKEIISLREIVKR